jgi:eukaryotic-like serine/threonine-protein kinase
MPVDPSATTDATPSAGGHQVIGERYEILGLLGSGGMGNVYKARDLELDELCALKVLRPELARDAEVLDRFRREVKLARRVTHPNVARVFDIGERGGEKILTMELVEGEPLSALLARDGPLAVERIVELGSAVCAGLSAAHEAGVIHRDLKPDNVLVEKGGRVVLTDFGIARAAASAGALATAGFLGTPAYMAPEQIEGGVPIDARADLYALGAMLFELATGQRPWLGESVFAIAAARLLHPPPDPRGRRPDLPPALAALVLRCMARHPEDRFASASAVAAELAMVTLPRARHMEQLPVVRVSPGPGAKAFAHKRVAVLPFRNAGPPDEDYLADGLTEDVIDALSMAAELRVTSRGVVMRYKGSDRDPREVGRELDVQVVVDGTVRRVAGDGGARAVRISARLASVADGVQLWARRFDRALVELLGASDDVARAIADALAVQVDGAARPIATDGSRRSRPHDAWADHSSPGRADDLVASRPPLGGGDPRDTGASIALGRARHADARGPRGQPETRSVPRLRRQRRIGPHGEVRPPARGRSPHAGRESRGCARGGEAGHRGVALRPRLDGPVPPPHRDPRRSGVRRSAPHRRGTRREGRGGLSRPSPVTETLARASFATP